MLKKKLCAKRSNLAVVPVASFGPHAEATGTDGALPTIAKVAVGCDARIVSLGSAGATAFPSFYQEAAEYDVPHLRAGGASIPTPVPAGLGTLHNRAVSLNARMVSGRLLVAAKLCPTMCGCTLRL